MKALIALNIFGGFSSPFNPYFCQDFHIVCKNIIDISNKFDHIFILNNSYDNSHIANNYLPLVNSDDFGRTTTSFIEKLQCKRVEVGEKKTLAISGHYGKLIQNSKFDEVWVSGFSCTLDILPAVYSLIDLGQNICIKHNCCGDIIPQLRANSLDILRFMNVKIL